MQAPLEFTGNEAISLMHRDKAFAFRAIADFFEKYESSCNEIIEILREYADEFEAQAMVAELRDKL